MSTAKILRRWMDLDKELASRDGLELAFFAKRWKVSGKTVRRDLAAFRALGYDNEYELASPPPFANYAWKYKPGVRCMFAKNPCFPRLKG